MYFSSIDQIAYLDRETGGHWFSPGAVRYFGTRYGSRVWGGRYFVTSEKDPAGHAWDGRRRYTVRRATYEDGRVEIDTIGEFGEHANHRHAVAAIIGLLREEARA